MVLDAIQWQDATAERHDEPFPAAHGGLGMAWGRGVWPILASSVWNPVPAQRVISSSHVVKFVSVCWFTKWATSLFLLHLVPFCYLPRTFCDGILGDIIQVRRSHGKQRKPMFVGQSSICRIVYKTTKAQFQTREGDIQNIHLHVSTSIRVLEIPHWWCMVSPSYGDSAFSFISVSPSSRHLLWWFPQ